MINWQELHQAIGSRELGIPCIVGTEHSTRSLKNGDFIKIDLELGIIEKINWGILFFMTQDLKNVLNLQKVGKFMEKY